MVVITNTRLPSTVYKGKDITFHEGTEEWRCTELALADKTLAGLKRKIDARGKKGRTLRVPALYFEDPHYYSRNNEVKEVEITLLHEDDRHATIRYGSRKTDRVNISELYPLDHKTRLLEWKKAIEFERQAEETTREKREAVTPLTAASIREAVARQAEGES